MNDITIRFATPEDAADILAIYSYYVEKTAITFELEIPSLSEFQARIAKTLAKYPYLAAIRDGQIVGYAYAGTFKDRAACDHSVELTIYLSPTNLAMEQAANIRYFNPCTAQFINIIHKSLL